MNYELALKLKEAGFSQKETNPFYPIGYGVIHSPTHYGDILMGQRIVIPTLEELIEACGSAFEELNKIDHTKNPRWSAISYSCEECGLDDMNIGYGQNPEEAVANLWLELNVDNSVSKEP